VTGRPPAQQATGRAHCGATPASRWSSGLPSMPSAIGSAEPGRRG